jgi:hypothetical protein
MSAQESTTFGVMSRTHHASDAFVQPLQALGVLEPEQRRPTQRRAVAASRARSVRHAGWRWLPRWLRGPDAPETDAPASKPLSAADQAEKVRDLLAALATGAGGRPEYVRELVAEINAHSPPAHQMQTSSSQRTRRLPIGNFIV